MQHCDLATDKDGDLLSKPEKRSPSSESSNRTRHKRRSRIKIEEGKKISELNGTLVTVELTHEFFPGATTRDSHCKGWNGWFEPLERYLRA